MAEGRFVPSVFAAPHWQTVLIAKGKAKAFAMTREIGDKARVEKTRPKVKRRRLSLTCERQAHPIRHRRFASARFPQRWVAGMCNQVAHALPSLPEHRWCGPKPPRFRRSPRDNKSVLAIFHGVNPPHGFWRRLVGRWLMPPTGSASASISSMTNGRDEPGHSSGYLVAGATSAITARSVRICRRATG